jgi:hypothetical protein
MNTSIKENKLNSYKGRSLMKIQPIQKELMQLGDEKGKRCPKCKIKNHINNTLCWFCNEPFKKKEKYNETKT